MREFEKIAEKVKKVGGGTCHNDKPGLQINTKGGKEGRVKKVEEVNRRDLPQ